MSDIAAHLVDEVLPKVPSRQWVCSLPWRLRYAMGYDRRLCADVLAAFIGAVSRSLRRRAKRELGSRSSSCYGSMSSIRSRNASSPEPRIPSTHLL
jgi:hypothetical protein